MRKHNPTLLLTPPFPDEEIVNGFVERACQYTCKITLSLACRQLFSRRPGLDGMPSGLNMFHNEFGFLYGDLDTLVNRHTLFGLYSVGLPVVRIPEQWANLVDTHPGPTRLCRLPVLATDNDDMRLECPECREAQFRTHGFCFIHRKAVAPFVRICAIHGVLLQKVRLQGWLFDAECYTAPTSYQRSMSLEYSQCISECIDKSRNESPYTKEQIIETLASNGWFSESGRLYLNDLLKEFCGFFAGAFSDARLSILASDAQYVEAAVRALTRPDRALHPTWCILFAWFSRYCQRAVHPRPSVQLQEKRHTISLTQELVRNELSIHGTVGKTAKALGIDPARLAFYCKAWGLHQAWRPKRLLEAQINSIVIALEAGEKIQEVTKKFRISMATAYRIKATINPTIEFEQIEDTRLRQAQQAWCLAIRSNPSMTTTEIRHLHAGIWTYLHRHAADWLATHRSSTTSTSRHRIIRRHAELLRRFYTSVQKAHESCIGGVIRPIHRSRYRLNSAVGVSDFAYLSSVPTQRNEWLGEQRLVFLGRRLDWAMNALPKGEQPKWLRARTAGLRVSSIEKADEFRKKNEKPLQK